MSLPYPPRIPSPPPPPPHTDPKKPTTAGVWSTITNYNPNQLVEKQGRGMPRIRKDRTASTKVGYSKYVLMCNILLP